MMKSRGRPKKRRMDPQATDTLVPECRPSPIESPAEPTSFSEFIRSIDFKKIQTGEELVNSEIFKDRWQQTKHWYQQQKFKF